MTDVREHYDRLLGPVYTWMLGDFEHAYAANVALFDRLRIQPSGSGIAVDLGAGPGCQSLPLAERGFRVAAFDFCAALLAELEDRAAGLPIDTHCADIVGFSALVPQAELVVCMGDTLVHLPDFATVDRLLAEIAAALDEGGAVVVSIRDYVSPGPSGADRFIPIRASEDRIFTCFLEYEADTVQVHDILHERRADGWRQTVSGYRKLRLGIERVATVLEREGLKARTPVEHGGMLVLTASK